MSVEENKNAENNVCKEGNKGTSEDVGTETNVGIEEEVGSVVVDENDVKDDIMKIFEDADYAYPLEDIIEELRKFGYVSPGSVVLGALQRDVLYIDSIEDDGIIYLAVTEE